MDRLLAYLVPDATIKISGTGEIKATGILAPYQSRIVPFLRETGLKNLTIRYKARRFYFPKSVDEFMQQRLRNFFAAECPIIRE